MISTSQVFFTKTELKNRGWTDAVIKKFLGKPDKTSPNSRYKKASEVKLFYCERVEEIEKSQDWQDWYQKISEKREQRKKLNEQRIQKERAILLENPVVSFNSQIRRDDIVDNVQQLVLPFERNVLINFLFNEKMKRVIQETIFRTLEESWWYPVDRLLVQFYRTYSGNIEQSEQKIDFLKQSILENGWKGYPLIAWFGYPTHDPDGKEFLLSGYHRLEALKELREQEKIDKGFLVPVFSLEDNWEWLKKKMLKGKMFKKDKKLIKLTNGELSDLLLKELCRHGSGFMTAITDLDNY